jgi:hypothetical protein
MDCSPFLISMLVHLAIKYGDAGDTGRPFASPRDAAYADDPNTRRSTEGYVFQLVGRPVD